MNISSISPHFVEFIPRELEPGKLYISERFSTAAHACACGCGEKVVTPLSPANWRLDKHGHQLVSLYPSIGNWNYACKSHYWITRNRIIWAAQMTERQIALIQKKDLSDQEKYVQRVNALKKRRISPAKQEFSGEPIAKGAEQSLWQRLLNSLRF